MYYDEQFVASLPDDPDSALLQIFEAFYENCQQLSLSFDDEVPFDLVSQTHALLSAYLTRTGASSVCADSDGSPVFLPQITGEQVEDARAFQRFIGIAENEIRQRVNRDTYSQARQKYGLMLGAAGFYYEFSEGDLNRIQKLVNELRDLIAASEELEDTHKRRVLKRLEKLQSELHKKVSDLDVFYGTVIELSVVARIVGENVKPLVDRIRELVGIVWPTQARAFDLPSDAPFRLPGQTDDEKS